MSIKRKRYSNEFKLEVIGLVVEQDYSVAKASEAMGVGKSTLDRWVRQYKKEKQGITPETGKALTTEQQEIQKLRKENQRLKLERDILKKASALLAQDNLNAFK